MFRKKTNRIYEAASFDKQPGAQRSASTMLGKLSRLWKSTIAKHFDSAPGLAGEVEARTLALERCLMHSPLCRIFGAELVFWLLGATEHVEGLLELRLARRESSEGVALILTACFDCFYEELFFEVSRTDSRSESSEVLDWDDATGALIDFLSDRRAESF